MASNTRPKEPELVGYTDEERDNRDSIISAALNAAIQLIADDDADHIHLQQATAVIRLAREHLEAGWAHGKAELIVDVPIRS